MVMAPFCCRLLLISVRVNELNELVILNLYASTSKTMVGLKNKVSIRHLLKEISKLSL